MASEMEGNFDSWLKHLLDNHDVDGEVFGEYIGGTLATMEDSTAEEISENLRDILSAYVEDETVCKSMAATITEKWTAEVARKGEEAEKENEQQRVAAAQSHDNSQDKGVPSSARQTSTKLGGLSATEKKRLVAQYDCESDGDDDVDEEDLVKESKGKGGGANFQGLFQNLNASHVTEAERQKKKEQKAAHEAKLERDKKSREAQKQKAQDRKEKEKKRTQKQEKRR